MEGVNGKDALTTRTRTTTRDLPPPRSTKERVVNAVCVPRAGVITTPECRCFIIHLSAQARGRARGWWRANPDVSESATEVTPTGRQVTGGAGPGAPWRKTSEIERAPLVRTLLNRRMLFPLLI